jgi:hypothetical protein
MSRPLVVTYQLAYLSGVQVTLCDACVERDDHECGKLGPVMRGARRGECDGAQHGRGSSSALIDVSFDDATDVQAIRYRLHPGDVGFDLRAQRTPIVVEREESLRCSYPDEHGERRVMAGPFAAVVARLRALGFDVEVA